MEEETFSDVEKKLLAIQGIISDKDVKDVPQDFFIKKVEKSKKTKMKIFNKSLYIDCDSDSEEESVDTIDSDIVERAVADEDENKGSVSDEDSEEDDFDDYDQLIEMLADFGINDSDDVNPRRFFPDDFYAKKSFDDVFADFQKKCDEVIEGLDLVDAVRKIYDEIDSKDFSENDYFIRVFGADIKNVSFLFHFDFNLLWMAAKKRDLREIYDFLKYTKSHTVYNTLQLSSGHIVVCCSGNYYLMPAESRRIFFRDSAIFPSFSRKRGESTSNATVGLTEQVLELFSQFPSQFKNMTDSRLFKILEHCSKFGKTVFHPQLSDFNKILAPFYDFSVFMPFKVSCFRIYF